ncbi:hypothetical protein SAMN05421856_101430 [Chryseobacterium taichungense]|uniref:Uncharacterized protein n=1 Tax=Chryseobacterium taichungense TaxID=295069 RepID=A0A1H7W320_9FLAO|nr:hypothetical protein [Chryseobacterium taichungense]SEM15408.1 hypothetical protein SAMN05421856_101430 [Chryseobacterium taichungense]
MAKKQTSVRMTDEVRMLLEILCEKRNHNQVEVIEAGIRSEARKEKITAKEIQNFKNKNKI